MSAPTAARCHACGSTVGLGIDGANRYVCGTCLYTHRDTADPLLGWGHATIPFPPPSARPCYRCGAPIAGDPELHYRDCPPAPAYEGEPIGRYCRGCAAGDHFVTPDGYPLSPLLTIPPGATCDLCGGPLGGAR